MDTLPLPPRAHLDYYRKRVKELVAAARSPDPDALRHWAGDFLSAIARQTTSATTPFVQQSFDRALSNVERRVRAASDGRGEFNVARAQFVLANAHGFATWGDFARHVEGSAESPFEHAADAVVHGDLDALDALLRADPDLIRARSARVHRCTLLHYVAANGVEDFRQLTPPNALAIAERLLAAGAEVDALAETYGGGSAQTTMNLLVSSAHPHEAGLQSRLAELLLDHGAAIDGVADDCSPLMTALGFGYGETAGTLARRGARIDNVLAAAGVGREDLVRRWVIDADTLAPEAQPVTSRWPSVPRDPRRMIEIAFVWSVKFDRRAIFDALLEKGVSVAAADTDDMTALHWAAALGRLDYVDVLLARGAPLEVRNVWDGTVLASTCYFALHAPMDWVDYVPVLQRLIAAGADTQAAAWAANDARISAAFHA
jgi:hypothetical protein